jgi:hypothetical protein
MESENLPTEIDATISLIEKLYPKEADAISTIAFVHWHNIVNHCGLENIDEKQTVLIATMILALASSQFKSKNENFIDAINDIKEVSFNESIDFLSGNDKKDS